MARPSSPTRRPPAASEGATPVRGSSGSRRRGPVAREVQGEPVLPEDLVDVEAPSEGGAEVNTPAYAAPPESAGEPAIASDLVDVEAPPSGGARVDTAAYARPDRRGSARKPRGAEAPSMIDAQAPPPPPPEPARGTADGDDPLGGEAGGAPPRAGPELGGGEPVLRPGDLLERAALAALRLAADRPWPEVTLRDVAREAGVPFAALYARAPGRRALLLALSARLDRQALERTEGENAPAPRDRLFEGFMSRLEVMAPHRDALLAVGRSEGVALAPALPRTVRALAEGAGVDTSGARGALRLAALTGAWARTLQVWRDDEGALNRTMAEIDKLLTRADQRLSRVGAGF